jgi:hypothetical protein
MSGVIRTSESLATSGPRCDSGGAVALDDTNRTDDLSLFTAKAARSQSLSILNVGCLMPRTCRN